MLKHKSFDILFVENTVTKHCEIIFDWIMSTNVLLILIFIVITILQQNHSASQYLAENF